MNFLVEFVAVTMGMGDFNVASNSCRIPELMKVGRIVLALRMLRVKKRLVTKILHRHTVSAVVGIGDGVKRLMHVPDKMNEVADGFGALQGIGRLVFSYGALLFACAGP